MNRRSLIALSTTAALFAVAACGDSDSATPATEPPPEETLPPVSDPGTDAAPGDGYDHATGADDVVIRIGYEGGFVTPEITFQQLPTVLVTGDGRLFQQGPVIAIYPGPLLPNVQERSISDSGIQELLALADEFGLLEEREYEAPTSIADAPDTVVEVTVGGETYVHRAYALGLVGGPEDAETDEDRASLAAFVEGAQAIATAPPGDTVGPEESFEPETYLIRTLIVGDGGPGESELDDGIEPRVVDWPTDVPVRLDGEIECAEVPAESVQESFESADQLTWFADDGTTYQVFVKPQLPGDGC